MGLPRFVVIKSNFNNKYLRFIKEDVLSLQFGITDPVHGLLQFSGDEVLSPYAKHEVQTAKCGKGLVNIRCCYNNKYWRRWSDHQYWICAAADEPEEDRSKWSCTLFEPVYLWHVRFRHVQLNRYGSLCELGKDNPFDSCLYGGTRSPAHDNVDVCTIINWESLLILPKHVAFKGNNGNYLSARSIEGHPYLQFASSTTPNIGDPTVGNQVFITGNGSVRIKSDHLGKFWRRCSSPEGTNWIWSDSDVEDTTTTSDDTLFWPIKVSNHVVALRNLGNNNFCSRLTQGNKTSCLNAAVPTISRKAYLQVEELVSSRNVYDVNYHIEEARIYDQISEFTLASGYAVNKTQKPKTVEVKLAYTEKKKMTWNASINSLKYSGIKTNIETDVPLIEDNCAEEKIKISTKFTGEYQWGHTHESTYLVEYPQIPHKVNVPPRSKVKVSLVAKKASCDIPFSYSQCDTLKYSNGQQITYTMEDGLYTCTNYFHLACHPEENPPEENP